MGNLALMCVLSIGRIVSTLFLGKLRETEVEVRIVRRVKNASLL